jgi:hypothetical protein
MCLGCKLSKFEDTMHLRGAINKAIDDSAGEAVPLALASVLITELKLLFVRGHVDRDEAAHHLEGLVCQIQADVLDIFDELETKAEDEPDPSERRH